MSKIEVKKIVKAIETSDGAGVKLKRSIGISELDFIDPFLMLLPSNLDSQLPFD